MGSVKRNFCPVCGFELDFPSWTDGFASDEICPSCGIQYGYDDMAGGNINKRSLIYKEWRDRWIKQGMPWNSIGMEKPPQWDPIDQLKNIKINENDS